MRFLQPANLFFLSCFIAYCAIRGVFEKRTKRIETTHSRADALDRTVLFCVVAAGLLLPVIYLFTPFLWFADYRLPRIAQWIGAGLMPAALWLFWRSHSDLGRNWSVTLEIRKDHQLITHGVYRAVRHPMYASIFLFSIAQGLLLANWLAGWSSLITFSVLYLIRTPREERMMCEFFGRQYEDYMARTGRLFPRLIRRSA